MLPFTVSLARLPGMICYPFDHEWTLLEMLASAPWAAMPGVSVLPSSVMSGPPLPLVRAFVQSVPRFVHGIQSTTTLVFLYCGLSFFHWATTPFIQVVCDATAAPMRQTTSLAGAEDPDPELPLEPHPATAAPAIAATAPSAAADLLKVTDRSPFPAVLNEGRRPPGGRLRPGRGLQAGTQTLGVDTR